MNHLFKAFILLFFLVSFGNQPLLQAQTKSSDLATKYNNAKQLLQAGKYQLTMAELQPVISAGNASYTPAALYLFANAAVKAKKFPEATQKLNQLRKEFSSWENIEEAIYLEATAAFEQKLYDQALNSLENIEEKNLEAEIAAMKYQYLNQITDKALLQNLVNRHPNDKVLSQIYADKLISGWYTPADQEMLENLVKKHKLNKNKYAVANLGTQKKTHLNVALLLPFPQNATEAKARKNQFVTDLYAGMLLARDSLSKQQIELNLFAYDAPADTNKIKSTLQLPEMASMDLIVGPVYKSANKIITRFAQQHGINSINPLSEDLSLVKDNPNLYLFEASVSTRARQSAAYAFQNFPVKKGIIITETTREDTAFANAYKKEFERLGGKITLYKKFNAQNTSGATLFNAVDLKTTGHLLLLSNKPSVAVYTLSNLDQNNISIPLITYPSWLNVNQISLSQFDNRNIYFIYPKYIDNTLPGAQHFRRKYSGLFHVPPSVYAYSGFEMLYYFGNVLHKYGSKFNGGLQTEGPVSGVVFQGIGYGNSHDNQYVPLVKMENAQLIVVNPIFR